MTPFAEFQLNPATCNDSVKIKFTQGSLEGMESWHNLGRKGDSQPEISLEIQSGTHTFMHACMYASPLIVCTKL